MMKLTRAPSGSWYAAMILEGERVFLDLDAKDPADGVGNYWFIKTGAGPAQSSWASFPWEERFASVRVITYREIVKPNVDLMRWLSARERERLAWYARIPARRRAT